MVAERYEVTDPEFFAEQVLDDLDAQAGRRRELVRVRNEKGLDQYAPGDRSVRQPAGGDVIEQQPAVDGDAASPTAAERGAVDRRTAMKAALGGAVAARHGRPPASSTSRSPGLRPGRDAPALQWIRHPDHDRCQPLIGFTSECYGNCVASGGVDCGPATVVYPGPVSGSFPPGVTMTVVYNGYVEGSDIFDGAPGTADITVSGIRSPQQRCSVTTTQTPACAAGQFSATPDPVQTFTSTIRGPLRQSFGCGNLVGSQRIRLTLRLTLGCTCVECSEGVVNRG